MKTNNKKTDFKFVIKPANKHLYGYCQCWPVNSNPVSSGPCGNYSCTSKFQPPSVPQVCPFKDMSAPFRNCPRFRQDKMI